MLGHNGSGSHINHEPCDDVGGTLGAGRDSFAHLIGVVGLGEDGIADNVRDGCGRVKMASPTTCEMGVATKAGLSLGSREAQRKLSRRMFNVVATWRNLRVQRRPG